MFHILGKKKGYMTGPRPRPRRSFENFEPEQQHWIRPQFRTSCDKAHARFIITGKTKV
jgi:hypothetical protein